MIPRMKTTYLKTIRPALMERFGFTNVMQAPRLAKVVVNMGLPEVRDNIKGLDLAIADLASVTGQTPAIRRAKKSISNFRLREGMPIGIMVTLRGARMYEFMDRLVSTALPRIRDFRGLSPRAFDGRGNYNLGLREQFIFSEVKPEKSERPRGMNVTLVTTGRDDKEARALLEALGMPFMRPAAPLSPQGEKPGAAPRPAAVVKSETRQGGEKAE